MNRMRSLLLASGALCVGALFPLDAAHAQGTRLLRHPAITRDAIAFEYGGDLWSVSRSGGGARRLTATPEMDTDPVYSPDGTLIAFTHMSGAGGASDVYVMPAAGGDARRLTFYPGVNRVRGWTPDGKRIVFASDRASAPQSSYLRMFTIAKEGGAEDALPMPRAFSGTLSPDGRHIAYEEISTVFIPGWFEASGWRHYRGGRTHPISIMNLADHSVEKLPWTDSNDSEPVWVGNTVYFLSDRAFTTNVFSYRLDTKELKQLTRHDDFDVANLAATEDGVVYEQGGWLHLIDPRTGTARQLAIDVAGDFAWARPQFKKVAPMIREAALSPTGARAVFEARGDIFTVPGEKGDWRNLTRSSGAHDHSPAWSPDGSQVAWLSDQSGEYQLMIGDQLGATKPRAIALPSAAFFSQLSWSPDGKRVSLEDNHLNLWVVDLASDRATKIDTDTWNTPGRGFDAVWSPDSRWLSYSRSLPSHLRAIFVRSLGEGRSFQLTDGFADATSPAFDAGGRYLYFLASTDVGLRTSWLDMSQLDHQIRRVPYMVVLRAEDPSPLLPESNEEPTPRASGAPIVPARAPAAARPATPDSGVRVESAGRPTVRIDEPGIRQRILALGVPAGDLEQLTAGSPETFFFAERAAPAAGSTLKLQRFQIKDRAVTTVLEGIRSFSLSADNKKLLYSAGAGANARWGIVSTERPAKVGDGVLNVAQLEMRVDPPVEWAEIFRESWRIQREYFYDASMHGADWKAVFEKYYALVPWVRHRAELGYLMAQVGGELVVGHSYLTGPGDETAATPTTTGLLGADYAVENGLYRIKRIYTGESWNPELRAPLTGPGVHVSVGDYLLEVDGRPVTATRNVYEPFEETAGRQTVIRVGPTPSGEGSRLVTVVPVPSEDGLRTRAWIEDNRRKVDSLSNGRLAYVWLPNTGQGGYAAFTRYFFAQQDKQGAIIDERYNHGGMVADFIVSELSRRQTGGFAMRDGLVATSPTVGIYGPKVMLINESAGSGGDALPYNFRVNQIGPLIGTRTWGGLVGTTGTPPTIDGGGITSPSLAFFDLKNQWRIENEGVAPDIEVENDAASVIAGRDPQLERGVQEALRLLDRASTARIARPGPIDRASKPAGTR
jgi:tricorn protease